MWLVEGIKEDLKRIAEEEGVSERQLKEVITLYFRITADYMALHSLPYIRIPRLGTFKQRPTMVLRKLEEIRKHYSNYVTKNKNPDPIILARFKEVEAEAVETVERINHELATFRKRNKEKNATNRKPVTPITDAY